MPNKGKFRAIDGVVLLDKPGGISSNSALQQTRSIFRAKKAGHTGSLDPLATGLLPICLGEATKVSGYLLDADKHYRATCQLGVTTDTGDCDGQELKRCEVPALTNDLLEQVFSKFRGDIMQIPPMYSAISVDGKRLYKLARAGKVVERQPRPVTIRSLDLIEHGDDQFVVDVVCSKGTYIRTLLEDIGAEIGCGAHMTALRRHGVSPFVRPEMVTIATLDATRDAGEDLGQFLLPVDEALVNFPKVALTGEQSLKIQQGQRLVLADLPTTSLLRLYHDDGHFIGIGEYLEGELKGKRLLRTD